jgi:hypothetical protein
MGCPHYAAPHYDDAMRTRPRIGVVGCDGPLPRQELWWESAIDPQEQRAKTDRNDARKRGGRRANEGDFPLMHPARVVDAFGRLSAPVEGRRLDRRIHRKSEANAD